MKLIYNIIFLLIFSCSSNHKAEYIETHSENKEFTEAEKRCIFFDSVAIASEPIYKFEDFMEKYYSKVKIENSNIHPWYVPFSQFLLEETFSSILKETNSLKSIRVFVIPALDYPYCYKIELKNKLSYLTYKTSTKLKNTRIGYLNSSKTTLHNDSIFINFSNKLSEIDFKKVNKDTTTYGWTDGFELFVEEFDSGNYRYCHIRNPFGSDDANTLKLWSTIKMLFEFE